MIGEVNGKVKPGNSTYFYKLSLCRQGYDDDDITDQIIGNSFLLLETH